MNIYGTREGDRLRTTQRKEGHWNRWGPFLSDRAWGTVREDYSMREAHTAEADAATTLVHSSVGA